MLQLTPTETKLYNRLADGNRHSREELVALIDTWGDVGTLYVHMHRLRKKLGPGGTGVVLERENGTIYYRYVRFVSPTSSQ